MSPTPEDLTIEAVIRKELDEGLESLANAGFIGAKIRAHRHPRTDVILFEFGGRFEACPDRDVYSTVEVDPARLGWRLEGNLLEYPDADEHDSEIGFLGSSRIEGVDSAAVYARTLATAACVAVLEYSRDSCRGDASR
jgi:hypothetical protein